MELKLLIHCRNMPGRTFGPRSDVLLGIQKGRDVIDEVPGDAAGAEFTAIVRVARQSGGEPNFLGPYAHGTPDDRFLYLSWSGVSEGERAMFRRAKLRLGTITWEMIDNAIDTERPLEVTLDMTDQKGGPACATLKKQVSEWRLSAP